MPESKTARSKAAKKGWRDRRKDTKTNRTRSVRTERVRSYGKKHIGKPKPIQMILFGLLGKFGDKIMDSTGIPDYVYSKSPQWREIQNSLYAKDGDSSATHMNKILGAALGVDAGYKSVKSGKVSGKALNMELPYTIGSMFDGITGNSGGSSSNPDW